MAQTLPPGTGSAKSATRDPGRPIQSDMAGGQPAEPMPAHDPGPAPQPPGEPGGSQPMRDTPPAPMHDRGAQAQAGGQRSGRRSSKSGDSKAGDKARMPTQGEMRTPDDVDADRGGVMFDENKSGR